VFLRIITDNFARRPRRKLLTGAALALGMAVATATLSISLDIGDKLAKEFRSLGANLVVTPEADWLPLEIGGVDYRPVNAGAYLPESDLPKIKTVFWRNNIIAFAPVLETEVEFAEPPQFRTVSPVIAERKPVPPSASLKRVAVIGTWAQHELPLSDGSKFTTGIPRTNPWWRVEGRWFSENMPEAVVGVNLARRLHLAIGANFPLLETSTTNLTPREFTVVGLVETGGSEDSAIIIPLPTAQKLVNKPGQYRKLYVSALTKPEDDFARRDLKTMTPDELERWSCSPYVSSIAYSIKQVLPGSDVQVIRRVAEGEGKILTRVRALVWLVTFASLLAAALAVGASSAASVIERRTEIGLMKALGAGSATVGFLLAAEQLLLAFLGGCLGYALGLLLARFVGTKIFGAPPEPSLLVLGVILVLAAAVTLLGSALPLRRAAAYDPAPILRGE
jgi:putative ABC transport system permease protein